jgi:hypothetical protein
VLGRIAYKSGVEQRSSAAGSLTTVAMEAIMATSKKPHRKPAVNLTQEIVRELLDYDPVTGVLTWRWRDRKWFDTDGDWKRWNGHFAGRPAGSITFDGYVGIEILYRSYQAHRVIFLWVEGRWPDPEVDHENHNRADNRWVNLVESNDDSQSRNYSLRNDNTSGRVGVRLTRNGKFNAFIGKNIHIGNFETFEAACAAREDAECEYGFHRNHGANK